MQTLILKPPLEGTSRNVVRDFVYGCWCNGRRVGGMQMPPLNDLYVATHARNAGLEILFLDAQLQPERYHAIKEADFSSIGAVVLLCSTQSFVSDSKLLAEIKSIKPSVNGILFGSHPTFMPNYCLSNPAVDFIVLREPEESLRQLLICLRDGCDPSDIEGIGFRKKDGQVVITNPRPFLDMDDLPIPDRSLLPDGIDYFNPVVKQIPYTTMQTSRGCPGRCIFCTAPQFYGRKIRCRSTHNVLAEIREIIRMGYREIFFRDETFTAYRKRNVEICKSIIDEKLDIAWIANGRVDMVDKDIMALMKRAGCHMIKFGVETGSKEILKDYKKGTTLPQARKAFAEARVAGLDTHAHIIIGGPGESEDTLVSTLAFVKELNPTTASFGILTPYPGTELFDNVACKNPEILDGSESNMENLHIHGLYSESICGLTGAYLNRWVKKCYRGFYMRPRYLIDRLFSIRSLDHAMALTIAGLNIVYFALSGRK
jgi:anaerobic magnesium-protoporphyrin IX monomethyl ester cyclase